MSDTISGPLWHQRTPNVRLTPDVESTHSDHEEQPYSGGHLESYQPLSALDATDNWVSGWQHLCDSWAVNTPHPLEPLAFPSQLSGSSKAQGRPPTPEYYDHNSYLSFSPTSPTNTKREPDAGWLALSPPRHVPAQPLLDSPDSLPPDQFHYSQQPSPVEHDASSDGTDRSPRSFGRYSPPAMTELPFCNQQTGYPAPPFERVCEEVMNQSPKGWLSFLSPEPQAYDESAVLGQPQEDQCRSKNVPDYHFAGHEGIPTNVLSAKQNFGFSAASSIDGGLVPVESSTLDTKFPANVDSRVTSRESSVSANGRVAGAWTSSSHASSLSSSRQGTEPVDEVPKPIVLRRSSTTATNRKRKEKGNVTKVEKTAKPFPSLHIVQEDGLGGSISHSARIPTPARARRNGPLSANGRRDAALRRKQRSVCVWCRLAKKKCSGQTPCDTCIEQSKTMIFEQPCVKADFFQIVESGTCNYISQRAVNHLTLDGSRRVRMELPESFEMKQLLSLLDERRGKFNIRARQSWGSLYVLDLNETHRFLEEISGREGNSHYDLGDFIDNRVQKANKWVRCIKETNPMEDTFSLLSQWNNMPSRASYDFVPLTDDDDPSEGQPMDVDNADHQLEILLAAQLSRIFCRKLEVDGYRSLQNALNRNKWDEAPHDSFVKFVSQLGQILLTLRWRVSWWELLGDGGSKPDAAKERYEERVKSLCKTLYFYYTSVKLKLPAWTSPSNLDGVWSTYADATSVWDDFPAVATIEGFDAWMETGKRLIHEAGVTSRMSKF